MALGKTAMKGGLVALMIAVMTGGAFAWEAAATTALNVRSGPGTQFRVVEVLERGEVVDVEYCRSGWCFLDMGWQGSGWASRNYLAQVGNWRPNPPRPNPPHWWDDDDDWRPRPPHWGHDHRPPHWDWDDDDDWRPEPPRHNSRVCFNGPNGYFCIGS